MVSITVSRIPQEVTMSSVAALERSVSQSRSERARRYWKLKDRLRCLYAECLLRYTLARDFGIEFDTLSLGENKYGKPIARGIEFNMTHSGDLVGCIVAETPVGIDIERIHRLDVMIAKRFFTSSEAEYVLSGSHDVRLSRFFDLWTLKESYIKALGKGMSKPLDSFEIVQTAHGPAVHDFCSVCGESNLFLKRYSPENGYRMAVAASIRCFPPAVDIVDASILTRESLRTGSLALG